MEIAVAETTTSSAATFSSLKEEAVGNDGMKVERMFYEKFEDSVRENDVIGSSIAAGQWDRNIIPEHIEDYV